MNFLITRTTDKLVECNVINEEYKELYSYGLQQGLIIIANILTTIAIGCIFKMIWQSIVFMIAYFSLRLYAGGYHAKSQLHCYLLSIVLTLTVLLAIRSIPWTNFTCLIVAFAAGIVIFLISPVEARNKPLDPMERFVYKKRTRIILMAEILILLLMFELRFTLILSCISVSLLALCVLLILGKLKC